MDSKKRKTEEEDGSHKKSKVSENLIISPERWWWAEEKNRQKLITISSEKKGEPLYVYSQYILKQQINRLQKLNNVDRLFFAIKSNSSKIVLDVIYELNLGFECVSLAEVKHVMSLYPSLSPKRILFTPNFAPRQEYEEGFKLGINVTLDNTYPLYNWVDTLRGKSIFIRVDPGEGLGYHEHMKTGGAKSKFGVSVEQLEAALPQIKELELKVEGLHVHKGSGIHEIDAWKKSALLLASWKQHFPHLKYVDLGGGIGIPYQPDGKDVDIEGLNAELKQFKDIHPEVEVWLEPGRFIVCEAGVILASVTQLKEKPGKHFLGINTGMNALIRPALYQAYHHIVNLSRLEEYSEENQHIVQVVGPICESGDVLGIDRPMPKTTQEGDVVLIACVGAYGRAMASQYNLRSPPEEVALD